MSEPSGEVWCTKGIILGVGILLQPLVFVCRTDSVDLLLGEPIRAIEGAERNDDPEEDLTDIDRPCRDERDGPDEKSQTPKRSRSAG